jgi:hypothetical protein
MYQYHMIVNPKDRFRNLRKVLEEDHIEKGNLNLGGEWESKQVG